MRLYSHSIRATTATLLLDAGVDIIKVKELLGHRHTTTTQIYDKRRRHFGEREPFAGDLKAPFELPCLPVALSPAAHAG